MIVDTIVGLITTVLTAIFGSLPSWSPVTALGLPSDVGTHDCCTLGGAAGKYVGSFDTLLPIHETISFLQIALVALLTAYATYKVASWIWKHIPEIGGFGPGAG